MKINRLILICMIILTCSLKTESQNKNDKSFLNKFYIKAGIEGASFSNPHHSFVKIGQNTNYFGGIMYDYSKHIQIEALYRINENHGNNIYNINSVVTRVPNYDETYEQFYSGETQSANSVDLKCNYFFMKDRTTLPFYLTSSIDFNLQKRTIFNIYSKQQRYSPTNIETQILDIKEHSYNRFLAGISAGVGFTFSISKVYFQTEFTFKSKVAPFVDRGYYENMFNLSFASSLNL